MSRIAAVRRIRAAFVADGDRAATGRSARGAPLARRGRLIGGCLAGRGRPSRCRASAEPSTLARGDLGVGHAAPGPALVAAAFLLVDGRPGAPLGFLLADAALLVAFLDVLRLALLAVGVLRFVAARHRVSSRFEWNERQR